MAACIPASAFGVRSSSVAISVASELLHGGCPVGQATITRWLPPVRRVPPEDVVSRPILGGLHHEYSARVA
jgi:hypothetical protein